MLLLADITEKVQIVLDAGRMVDVHAAYVDYDGISAVTPGRKNTKLTASGAADVVAPPAAGLIRNVKTLHIRNKDSQSVNVLVQIDIGGSALEIYSVSLGADQQLQYTETLGFLVL